MRKDRPELEDWFRRADEVCAEADEEIAEMKRVIEQNGTDVEPEQLVFGWFQNFKQQHEEG